MRAFTFDAAAAPFPRWWGPFSPARGIRTGFRFRGGRLGTWVENEFGREFWQVRHSPGVQALARLIRDHWGAGRVLLLPYGLVIKPLQGDQDVGERVVVGVFRGAIVLERPEGGAFDLSSPGRLAPGAPWPGPKTTGLECALQTDGSLDCTWYHPTEWGRDEICMQLHPPDRQLAGGFRSTRPGDSGGRVRVTAHGHVITNRQQVDGTSAPLYVGRVDPASWPNSEEWIGG